MSKEYEEYQRACAKIKEENAKLLDDFERWLSAKGGSEKTVREHVKNADFYINTSCSTKRPFPPATGRAVFPCSWASGSSVRRCGPAPVPFEPVLRV